jgi:nicotinate-nucleotide adenylyltransferase
VPVSTVATKKESPEMKKIGIMGGTFDPIHLGHLFVAEQCREIAKLEEVWFLPAFRPPHKDRAGVSSFADRLTGVELAIANNPYFRTCTIERDRPGLSYTVDTLRMLTTDHPEVAWHFILGADGIHDFPTWREPAEIIRLAHLCVVERPNHAKPDLAALAALLQIEKKSIRYTLIPTLQIDFASREIRHKMAEGKSIRYMVPEQVERWLEARQDLSEKQQQIPG